MICKTATRCKLDSRVGPILRLESRSPDLFADLAVCSVEMRSATLQRSG